NLGLLLQELGRRADAEAAYRRAIELQEALARAFPAVPAYRGDLAHSQSNLGNVLNEADRRTDAEAAYRRAIELQDALAREFPNVPEHRGGLASSHYNFA